MAWQPAHYVPEPSNTQLFDPREPPPPFAQPPADAALAARITKLADYIARNGPQFLQLIRTKQASNPDYAFLDNGTGCDYYQWFLYCTVHKMDPHRNPVQQPLYNNTQPGNQPGQQPRVVGAVQQPLYATTSGGPTRPPATAARGPQLPPYPGLAPDIDHTCLYVLHGLDDNQVTRRAALQWLLNHPQLAQQLAGKIAQYTHALQQPVRKLHVIYLLNDVLFSGLARRPDNEQQENTDPLSVAFKPHIESMVIAAHHAGDAQQKGTLERLVEFWKERRALPTADALLLAMRGPPPPSPPPLFDPHSFPPGLLPTLLDGHHVRDGAPYTPLEADDVLSMTLPGRPEMTPLLSTRIEQFYAELKEYKTGQSRAEYMDARHAARRAAGLPVEEDAATGVRGPAAMRGKVWEGRGARAVGSGQHDGSYRGPDAGRAAGLGLHTDNARDDVYSSYRRIRSGEYHTMIQSGR